MSLASKLTFGACCVCSVSIVSYVHVKQIRDKERLHQGVIRDIELQQRRKTANIVQLTRQQDLKSRLERFRDSELEENKEI